MALTKTAKELLIVALQDLHDAEDAWTERGPKLVPAAGKALASFLKADIERSAAQSAALVTLLSSLGGDEKGDPNIWLRAILDDAERDSESIEPGPLLDTALIGAFRKGKQAERVSYETALALASQLGFEEQADKISTCRNQERDADAELEAMLKSTMREFSPIKG